MGSVLCPVDGSDHSIMGLAHAIELSKLIRAHLTICTVNLSTGGSLGPTINQWTDAEALAILEDAEATAKLEGLSDVSTATLVSRSAAPAIITYAEEIGANQIVMGTGDKRGLERLVLGSVAAQVTATSGCSVTVAR